MNFFVVHERCFASDIKCNMLTQLTDMIEKHPNNFELYQHRHQIVESQPKKSIKSNTLNITFMNHESYSYTSQ